MGTKDEFKPRSLKSRLMWDALGCSVAVTGSWLLGDETGWSLVRMAALFLVIFVPFNEWLYRHQARAAAKRDD